MPPWLATLRATGAASPSAPAILADRGRSVLGPAVTAQRYLDKVIDRGLDAAPDALRETLDAVIAAIDGAKSYAEVEDRLVALAPDIVKRSADFEAVVEGAIMLGIGTGAWATGEEADGS